MAEHKKSVAALVQKAPEQAAAYVPNPLTNPFLAPKNVDQRSLSRSMSELSLHEAKDITF